MENVEFRYEFELADGSTRAYELEIDARSLGLVPKRHGELPEWTKLEFAKCGHCPLSSEDHPHCPVAANIAEIAEEFHDRISYEETTVRVVGPERSYVKRVPLQYGLFSILGLIMATSDCPYMRFLRPMARFHLPFASAMETIVRTVSMFLLRRYFEPRLDDALHFDLKNLDERYADVNAVNKGIVRRLQSVATGDADANAVIILHSLAVLLSQGLAQDLASVADIFRLDASRASSGMPDAPTTNAEALLV